MEKYPLESDKKMKIFGIAILMMILLMGFSLGLDLLLGFELRTSLDKALNPFLVMEAAELAVLYLFIFLFIIETFLPYYQKRKKKTKKTKKQPQGQKSP